MYDSKDIAWMFDEFTGQDPPCNFNGMDVKCDAWCEGNCGNVDSVDCWQHAVEEGWLL